MKKYVICHICIEGFHKWEQAPEHLSFLSFKHRHIFDIRVKFLVHDNNREIEIIETQDVIRNYIVKKYAEHHACCNFINMSCEDIAEEIMHHFNADAVQVLEDGFGGAELVRE